MTEPWAKRVRPRPEQVARKSSTLSLRFVTKHAKRPAVIDVTLFSTGASVADAAHQVKKKFTPFSGRPTLTAELFPHIVEIYAYSPRATAEALIVSLRWWWRFFDRCQNVCPVESVSDLTDFHYALYRNDPCVASYIRIFLKIVNFARAAADIQPLSWTAIEKATKSRELVSLRDVQQIYHHCKRPAFAAIERYRNDSAAVPTLGELNALFCILVLNTGWNQQVALDIDVSGADENFLPRCVKPHPQNSAYSVLTSTKARAGDRQQIAMSRNKSDLSPANIVITLIRQTSSLRRRLIADQKELIAFSRVLNGDELDACNLEIASIQADIGSPWLYQRQNPPHSKIRNGIRAIRNISANIVKTYAREINRKRRPNDAPISEKIVLSDLRDAFISWRWENSGYSWLDSMLAAGHSSRRSLEHYLNKKQHKQKSRDDLLTVTNSIWQAISTPISNMRPAMQFVTIISAKSQRISDAQIRRWLDEKDTTNVGMGCLDFYSPPREMSPDQTPGTGCSIQRCTLCPTHAVLLPTSYKHLSRRLVELRHLKEVISMLSWMESDLPLELENTEAALKNYDGTLVNEAIASWHAELNLDGKMLHIKYV